MTSARGDESECAGEHGVAGADLLDHQWHEQGVGAAGHGNGVGHAHVSCQFFLDLLDLGSQDVLAVVQDLPEAGFDRPADPFLLGCQVNELHFYFSFGFVSQKTLQVGRA